MIPPLRLALHSASLACALAAMAYGQDPKLIRAGDGTIDGARLQPYENAWLMTAKYKDGRVVDQGIWSDLLRVRDVDGRKLYVRTQGMTYQRGVSSFTINVFDPATLAPVSSDLHGADGRVIKRTFDGSHMESRDTPAGGTEHVTKVDLPVAVFDFNGGMYGTLFAAQKLTVGLVDSLPAVAEFTDAYQVVHYRVTARERIRAGSRGERDTYVVEVGDPVTLRFWISEEAPYVIRLVVPGEKADVLYEMIR